MIRALVAALAVAAVPSVAAAQQNAPRWSLGIGGVWTGGYAAGDSRATETSNPSVSPSPLQLFAATAHGDAAPGVVARVGWRLAGALGIEVEGQFSRPVLSASLTQDFESAAPATAKETYNAAMVGGSMVWRFGGRGRLTPFLSGGGGYVHRVTVESNATETSTELHAGGGLDLALSRRFALRADVRMSALSHPLGFSESRRYMPQVVGTVVYRR